MSDETFLSRWSRRKLASKAGAEQPPAPAAAGAPQADAPRDAAPVPEAPPPLPPVESLTPDSDFAPFMRQDTDPGLRQQALKTLFADPRFNVMDGLDVYIDDYSQPDPLPEGWLQQLNQVARLGEYHEPEPADPAKRADPPPAQDSATPGGDTPVTAVSTPVTQADVPPSSTAENGA